MKVNVKGIDRFPGIRQEILKEARREVFEQKRCLDDDFDAAVLWALHQAFGFGADRLRRFYDAFIANYDEMRAYYLGTDADGEEVVDGTVAFACKAHLLRIGVDVAEWNKEITRRKKAKEKQHGHHADGE